MDLKTARLIIMKFWDNYLRINDPTVAQAAQRLGLNLEEIESLKIEARKVERHLGAPLILTPTGGQPR